MRYFYEPSDYSGTKNWLTHYCDHPMYNRCTLYLQGDRGLAVVQQRFDTASKALYWDRVDPLLADDIYLNEDFQLYFEKFSGKEINKIFPTVQVRKLMWALRMKPLPKEFWERDF